MTTPGPAISPEDRALLGRLFGNTSTQGERSETQLPLGGRAVTSIGGRNRADTRKLLEGSGPRQPNAKLAPGQFGDGYTAEDVSNILRRMPPEKLAQVQRQMQASGMLPENFRTFGFVDSSTQSGFLELLEMSNTRNSSWDATLRALASGETTTEDLRKEQARKAAALSFDTQVREYRRTDPATLRRTAEVAFQEALGRNPTPEEASRFTDRFLAEEEAQQRTAFDIADEEALAGRRRALAGVDLENGGDGGIDAFMNALATQESGGNASARNSRTGAYGTFQIMPNNWAPWAEEAGLGRNAARTPENQERVARFKMEQYKQQFGTWEAVAVAWYAGPGAAKEYVKNPNAPRFTKKQGNGNEPSIREYASQVMGRLGGATTTAGGESSENQRLMAALQKMIADAPGKVTLGKTTRSYEEQVKLYEQYKSGTGPLAAKPGTSKHGDGRANDLKFENPAVKRWVLQNAARYGLAFPLLNAGEDWHVELAGEDHGGIGAAPVSRSFTTQDLDPAARAREQALRDNPAEAGAVGIGRQFNVMLGLLSRGVGI